MGQTDILTCVFALYGNDGYFYMRFCLIWNKLILKCIFALYGNNGHFNMRFCFIWDRR